MRRAHTPVLSYSGFIVRFFALQGVTGCTLIRWNLAWRLPSTYPRHIFHTRCSTSQ